MCITGIGGQETVCEDVDITVEQLREDGDFRTTDAGEPGADFLPSHSLRPPAARTHINVALG